MTRSEIYRVSEVARLSGVSVRTLHYYDEIGLLVPRRSRAGYRAYDGADLLRLQQILLGRELGLSLEAIRQQLDDPTFDHRRALLEQRAELERRARETDKMLRAIEAALRRLDAQPESRQPDDTQPSASQPNDATRGNEHSNTDQQERSDEMNELFDGFSPETYEAETRQRWGNTEAYRESARRTKSYGREQWEAIKAEQDAIYAALAALAASGESPDSTAAMEAAERHRSFIARWFYPLSREAHENLAAMYEQDERFAQNIDKYGEGLTTFLVAAIRANAR